MEKYEGLTEAIDAVNNAVAELRHRQFEYIQEAVNTLAKVGIGHNELEVVYGAIQLRDLGAFRIKIEQNCLVQPRATNKA